MANSNRKAFNQALLLYGPKRPFLRLLVRTRFLGYTLGLVLLLLYIAALVVMGLSPKPIEFKQGQLQQSIMVSNERE